MSSRTLGAILEDGQTTKINDKTGMRFGLLEAISFCGLNKYRQANWLCLCDCGEHVVVSSSNLASGTTKSCGCLMLESTRKIGLANTTHAMSHSREFKSWVHMRGRCSDPTSIGYKNYGGRGIRVYAEWDSSFQKFYDHVGPRPKGTSIDRIDNNGNYEPGNVRWATSKEQNNNKRSNLKNRDKSLT